MTVGILYGLSSIFLFLELTLIRLPLRAASGEKDLAKPHHDERFGFVFSKVSIVSNVLPFLLPSLSWRFHLGPFHIERSMHHVRCSSGASAQVVKAKPHSIATG